MLNVNAENGRPLRRRGVLAMLGGAAVAALMPLRPAKAEGRAVSALVFDGDALVSAGAQIRRHDPSGGADARLATPRAPIRALACHPGRPGRLYAAPVGGGILRSDDGGMSWRTAQAGLPAGQAAALAIAAGAPETARGSPRPSARSWRSPRSISPPAWAVSGSMPEPRPA